MNWIKQIAKSIAPPQPVEPPIAHTSFNLDQARRIHQARMAERKLQIIKLEKAAGVEGLIADEYPNAGIISQLAIAAALNRIADGLKGDAE